MKHNFEDFLMDEFLRLEPTILDDDIADGFDFWLSSLDVEDWLKYGDKFLDKHNKARSDDGR